METFKGKKKTNLSAGRHHILLVDDIEVNRIVVKKHLESAGYTVDTAADGSEAIRAFERGGHDLVLMDIEMPVLDGLESTKRIRCLERQATAGDAKSVPIIAMSGHALEEDARRYRQAGMNDCMVKPVKRENLLAVVRQWLEPQTPTTSGAAACDQAIEEGHRSGAGSAPIDLNRAIDEFLGDRETLERVLQDFVRTGSEQISTLAQALAAADFEQVRLKAHALRGGAANLTADRLAASCAGMEASAARGEPTQLSLLFMTLKNEFNRLTAYVNQTSDSAGYPGQS